MSEPDPPSDQTPADRMLAEVADGIGIMTFNNPARHNAVSLDMWVSAKAILDSFLADPAVRVIVVRGAGGKAFVSGADISRFDDERAEQAAGARYGEGRRPRPYEVWKLRRPVTMMEAGKTLRILARDPFEVTYTADGWRTQRTLSSRELGAAGSAADLPALPDPGEVTFTLYWPAAKRWQGENFTVKITKKLEPAPAPDNPEEARGE